MSNQQYVTIVSIVICMKVVNKHTDSEMLYSNMFVLPKIQATYLDLIN